MLGTRLPPAAERPKGIEPPGGVFKGRKFVIRDTRAGWNVSRKSLWRFHEEPTLDSSSDEEDSTISPFNLGEWLNGRNVDG